MAGRKGLSGRKPSWSDEMIDTLTRLLNDGLTFKEAAKKLGVSRNAAWGKMYRIKGPSDVKPTPTIKPPRLYAPDPVDPNVRGVSILEVTGCRWPLTGSYADTLFCDAPQVSGCPYCAAHRKRAWTGERVIDRRATREVGRAAA